MYHYLHPSCPWTPTPAKVSGTRLRVQVDWRLTRGLLSRLWISGMVCCPHTLSSSRADLLLATWTEHHFTDNIQTWQYRCPEVILGVKWGTSMDIWSVTCVVSPVAACPTIDLLLTLLFSRVRADHGW